MDTTVFDALVVGTGAAGLFAALSIPEDKKVLMITKDKIENSDSYLAQGGICMLKDADDFESFFEDTLKAGRYENRKDSVKVMIEESPEIIQELLDYQVDFDRKEDGSFSFTREGGHSTFRILHHQDVTGKEITSKLIAAAKQRKNITILEYAVMLDILEKENRCYGILMEHEGNIVNVFAKATILATGGMGGLFRHSTNFRHITGDSFAIALRHGVKLENLQYVQIHPTTLYSDAPGRSFLISESVRGEGAILLNPDKERFVDELLPRDVVTEAIKKEMDKYHSNYVYLSLENIDIEEIRTHFPNIYERCLEEGIDIAKNPIPVTPAQHYLMGGIYTDVYGQTTMENLFAVGETACNGVHGANRLASNSLLESLVFAKRAVSVLMKKWEDGMIPVKEFGVPENSFDKEAWKQDNRRLIMQEIKRKDEKFYDQWCNNET